MAAYDSLKSLVQQAIRTNGNNEITGQVLQNVLMAMIDELGGENGYAGVATPSTNPGAPDGKVFYFATEAGTYTHFDGATLAKGIHLLVFNGVTWSHQTLYTIDSEVTSGSNNLITSGAVYTKIINAINALDATVSKSAGADGLSLSLTETDGKVTSISGSIAPQTYDAYGAASAAQIAASTDATNKVNAAKTQILGDAASDYNTLGKLEDKIQAEASRAAAAESALNTEKADKATTLAGYGINDAYTKTEVNGLVSTPHQNYVTVPTYASLPATGSADTIYRVSNYNGSTSQVDASVYSEYAWNGSGYTFLRVVSQIGEVFDITVYNSNTKYADLAAALGTNGANVPSSIRRGGMSVKFVQSSDNKYVQYRLMADEFTTDTIQWAIAEEGVYVENPEFVYVKTDAEGKILWAIKVDGSIYYGAGVPQQVVDYINEKIAELSLDEYEDIVAFLNGLEEGDKTLQDLLDKKVNNEEGKSLIDAEYANGVRYIENPEFTEVKVDNEDRILEAIMKDGTKLLPAGVKVIGTAEYDGATIKAIENPEFASVWLDGEDKILFGIEQDGNFLFGCGVPKQVKEYIEQKIKELSLDEYESIVTFIGDYLNNTTLEELLSKKVDGEYVDNPEFIEAKVDAEDKVLEGIQKDGTKVIGGDLRVLGNMEVSGVSYKVVENPEYLAAWIDAEDKIIFGFKNDGKTYVGDADFLDDIESIKAFLANFNDKNIDWDALTSFNAIENPEFIEVELDAEDKVLGGRKTDGTKFENNDVELNSNATIGGSLEVDGTVIKNIEDPENRSEITLDSENKIISYRKDDGTLVENVGFETPSVSTDSLNLSESGMTEFQQALINAGFNPKDKIDWSDSKFVEIPIPSVCAIVNFGVDSQATSKSDRQDYNPGVNADIPTTIEYWDKNGNYFKKPILLSAQGNSSMTYVLHLNQAFDLDDGSEIKFGNWVSQDSFHVKKYYQDVFRGQCVVGYWLMEQVYQSRAFADRKPWDYLNQGGNTLGAIGKFNKDYYTGALAHPDGFPVHVFFNGNDAGLYALNLKKHRDNYYQKKDNTNNIILDGNISNGSLFNGSIDWTEFEIRNPKTKKKKDGWELVDVDGNKYDGDFPKELMGTTTEGYDPENLSDVKSAATKAVIERLSGAYAAILSNKTKETFEQYFNADFFIDYFVMSQVVWHQDGFGKNWIWCTWDGNKWTPTAYDLDSIFGSVPNGTRIVPAGNYRKMEQGQEGGAAWANTNTLLGYTSLPVQLLWDLYKDEIKERYNELRTKGIFTTDNIVRLLETWLSKVGYNNLKSDIEDVCVDSYKEGGVPVVDGDGHLIMVPSTPSYRDGSKTYTNAPKTGGCYNSVLRVKRWLDEHFAYLDSIIAFGTNPVSADFIAYRTTEQGYEIECNEMKMHHSSSDIENYWYISGHITKRERTVEGVTETYYTIDNGVETGFEDGKTYISVREAIEAAQNQEIDIPSSDTFYIQCRTKDMRFYALEN